MPSMGADGQNAVFPEFVPSHRHNGWRGPLDPPCVCFGPERIRASASFWSGPLRLGSPEGRGAAWQANVTSQR